MRIQATLAVLLTLCVSSVAVAQEERRIDAEPKGENLAAAALTFEEKQELQAQLKMIATALGADQPAPPVQPGQPVPPQKTAVDVADRALDMFGGLVSEISGKLEKVAPEVWRIMIRQQYAKAVADLIVPWSLFIAMIVLAFIVHRIWKLPDPNEYSFEDASLAKLWIGKIVPIFFCSIMVIWGANELADSIKYLINPEYYAVRDILIMLINPAQIGR